MQDISHIFRSYDIRGIYGKDLDEEIMRRIGNAFGQMAKTDAVVVARDMRLSSKSLKDAFIAGLTSSGKNVVDAGLLPLGVGMFYAWQRKMEFAYITASHLPKEWNGVKFFHANGMGFSENENFLVRDKVMGGDYSKGGIGAIKKESSASEMYIKHLSSKISAAKPLKILIDCGNGSSGIVAKRLFNNAGFKADALFEEPDGAFPNRSPDPHADELTALIGRMHDYDVGIAFDGDADRVVLVGSSRLTPEQMSWLILNELLKKEHGPIVANVECTRLIMKIAEQFGRDVIKVPVGHTFLVEAAHRHGACFGVEPSGHFIIPSIFPFDDAIAVGLYAARALSLQDKPLDEIMKSIPSFPFVRINFECSDVGKFAVIESLKERLKSEYENVTTMDGVRIDFDYGFVLMRASNTEPKIRLTVEADDENAFENLKKKFVDIVGEAIGEV